jgi:uncharacterized membrane protein
MQQRTNKIALTGILGAIAILLGLTRWGFIPWFGGVSLTIMHVPVIIGAILAGPLVSAGIGLIFGLFSMFQAAIAPAGPTDVWFTNPLLSVVPRLFIGPIAWLAYSALKNHQISAILFGAAAGSIANTVLVLGTLGLMGYLPWTVLGSIALINGVPEIIVSALISLFVIAAIRQIRLGKKQGADL